MKVQFFLFSFWLLGNNETVNIRCIVKIQKVSLCFLFKLSENSYWSLKPRLSAFERWQTRSHYLIDQEEVACDDSAEKQKKKDNFSIQIIISFL